MKDDENTAEDVDMQRLKDACGTLSEFFDTVQVFATREQDEQDGGQGTVNCSWGNGNWFARKGQITEWVLKADERARKEVREED